MILRGLPLVLQAAVCDGLAFDPFSLQQDCLAASEVDVGRGYLIRRPPHPQSRLMGWSAPSSRPTLGRCQQEELR